VGLREKYILICGNRRPEEDPRGSCGLKCPGLRMAFKEELGRRNIHKRFRALESSCLDSCATGPTVCVMPDNIWYAGVGPQDIAEIVESHLLGGRPVERLRARPRGSDPGEPEPAS